MMSRRVCTLLLLMALAASPAAATAHGGVVMCPPARPATQAAFGAPLPIGHGRVLAPVRPAMFFSRKGDRCAWHPPARVAG